MLVLQPRIDNHVHSSSGCSSNMCFMITVILTTPLNSLDQGQAHGKKLKFECQYEWALPDKASEALTARTSSWRCRHLGMTGRDRQFGTSKASDGQHLLEGIRLAAWCLGPPAGRQRAASGIPSFRGDMVSNQITGIVRFSDSDFGHHAHQQSVCTKVSMRSGPWPPALRHCFRSFDGSVSNLLINRVCECLGQSFTTTGLTEFRASRAFN